MCLMICIGVYIQVLFYTLITQMQFLVDYFDWTQSCHLFYMIDYIFIGLVVKQSSEVAFWLLTVFCNIEYHKIKSSEKCKISGMLSIG